MFNAIKFSFTLIFFSVLFSCNEYQKILNKATISEKNKAAEKYYKNGEYRRALNLFEQIIPSYKGKPQHQRIVFFFANCYFQTNDYYLASYQFENFVKSYPKSNRAIEALFMQAKSQYMLSPRYSLEQKETHKAMDLLQIFIDKYPNSEFAEEANVYIQELQVKLEKKDFEISKQYYTIRDYRAAINSIDNFIANNPGTIYREEALFYKFLSSYEIAINSIISKKIDRLESLNKIYETIKRYYPETIFETSLIEKLEIAGKEIEMLKQI
ncbi:MAG: outer membrane protein assembly factor BamD [Flavobacteriaceae bacterium]|nr:outer membrane protein assembly factor BamD [Flavobacteriaceae bacterium]